MKETLIILSIITTSLFSQSIEQEKEVTRSIQKKKAPIERTINSDIKQQRKGRRSTAPSLILNNRISTLEWTGGLKFITNNHSGNLKIKRGNLFLHNDNKITGNVVIDMLSMTNTDLPESKQEYLIGHLRNEDFFHVERFPTASLKINSSKVVEKLSNGKYNMEISGDLTIKSITNPITFTAIVDLSSDIKSATGTMQFNRSEFGVQYRTEMHLDDAKSFWNSATTTKETLKDKVIKDEIDIKFNVVSMPGLIGK